MASKLYNVLFNQRRSWGSRKRSRWHQNYTMFYLTREDPGALGNVPEGIGTIQFHETWEDLGDILIN
jgi:hypothetical protein